MSLTPWLSWLRASSVWLVVAEDDIVFVIGMRFPLFESSEAKTREDVLEDTSIAASIIRRSRELLDNHQSSLSPLI